MRAVGQDVEELDPGLRVEQAADVLRDLGDVLDDEQARLVSSVASAGRYHEARLAGPYPEVPAPDAARLATSGLDGEQDRPFAARTERPMS